MIAVWKKTQGALLTVAKPRRPHAMLLREATNDRRLEGSNQCMFFFWLFSSQSVSSLMTLLFPSI